MVPSKGVLVDMGKRLYNRAKDGLQQLRGVTLTDRRSIRPQLVTGVITLIISFLLLFATGAWASKETTSDHRSDIERVEGKLIRILDVVCIDHPEARQCRQ